MTASLNDHMRDLTSRLDGWLTELPAAERIDPLTDLRSAIAELDALVKRIRRDTLVELVDQHGVDSVAASFDVTTDRLLEVIATPIRRLRA